MPLNLYFRGFNCYAFILNCSLVSIIIPTYNRAHLIGETLDSVLAQTYQHWECIVVDDGSTDNTSELLKDYCAKDARFQYHQRPFDRPKGGNSCRNYGFELSKGDLIQWFDSDDLMYPKLLDLKLDKFNADSKIDFIVCGFKLVFANRDFVTYLAAEVPNYLFGYIDDKLRLNGQNILWKKDKIMTLKWDEGLHKYQDLDFIFKVLRDNILNGFSIPDVLVDIRVNGDSISSNQSSFYNKDRLVVRKRMYNYAVEHYSSEKVLRLYHLYLFEIRNLISTKNFSICFTELISSKLIPFKVKITILQYLFIYILFKKGLFSLTQYLIKVST